MTRTSSTFPNTGLEPNPDFKEVGHTQERGYHSYLWRDAVSEGAAMTGSEKNETRTEVETDNV